MMLKDDKDGLPVLVCRVKGKHNRFFGKFKDPDETEPSKRWKRIPGGPFSPEVDDEEKAMACARKWFELEMAHRALRVAENSNGHAATWPDVCDLFVKDVKKRVRGADGTRDEAEKRAQFLRRSPILCARPLALHDDAIAVAWVRWMLTEPLKRKGKEDEPRDPLTVRNAARILDAIYEFAQKEKYFPEGRRPTEAKEFKAEISGALKEKAKLQKQGRVACPTETVRAVVSCEQIPLMRRLTRRTAFFTGMAPGELHGLHIADYKMEYGVKLLDVHEQWTLARKGYPSRLAPLKTVHRARKLPVHRSLQPDLDAWVNEGWQRHVGRPPKPDDFLFVDEQGNPFREESSQDFLAEIRLANCDTTHKGMTLDIYSLRHSFATVARRAGASPATSATSSSDTVRRT